MCLHRWLFARFYDRMARASEEAGVREWRRELLARARGEVLEIGAGTGLNLDHYGDRVSRLVLSEPSSFMAKELRKRRSAGPTPEVIEAPAQKLPLPDAAVDTVVCTLVLCSVADVARVLAEIRRVLRPSGRLLFIEHVLSDDPRVQRRQRLVQPFWKWLACGCHLTRDTGASLVTAGFALREVRDEPMPESPSFVARTLRGVAEPQYATFGQLSPHDPA